MKKFIKTTWFYWLLVIEFAMLTLVPDIIFGNVTWATVTTWFSALTIGSVFGTILYITGSILAVLLLSIIFSLFIRIVINH